MLIIGTSVRPVGRLLLTRLDPAETWRGQRRLCPGPGITPVPPRQLSGDHRAVLAISASGAAGAAGCSAGTAETDRAAVTAVAAVTAGACAGSGDAHPAVGAVGVNVDGVVRTLVTRGLIEETGHDHETGAHLYRTTTYFLERLGLKSLDELPPIAAHLPMPDNVEEVLDLANN